MKCIHKIERPSLSALLLPCFFACAAQADELLSENMPVAASSQFDQNYVPGVAVDGVTDGTEYFTWWASADGNNEWLEVDLTQNYRLTHIDLFLGKPLNHDPGGASVASDYTIETFSGGQWQPAVTVNNNSQREPSHNITATTDKVRFTCTYTGICRLREIQVYGYVNTPPVADAGPDRTIALPQNSVTLSGSGTDIDGDNLTYLWEQLEGPQATLNSQTSSELSVDGLREGEYLFSLTVDDGNGGTDSDTVSVTVEPGAALISVNQSADASSTYDQNYPSSLAVDGVIESSANYSWWASAPGTGEWLSVDLGGSYVLSEIRLYMGKPLAFDSSNSTAAANYLVEVFNNGQWSTLATVSGNTQRDRIHAANNVIGSRVRFTCTDWTICRLREIEIYGAADGGSGNGGGNPTDVACQVGDQCDAVVGNGSGVIWIKEGSHVFPDYSGKTMCIRAGTYSGIWLNHVVASNTAPLKIINCDGQVVSHTTNADAISIENYSRFIELTGTGSSDYEYGFVAWSSGRERHMVNISSGSSDVKLEYIEAKGDPSGGDPNLLTGGSGIAYKTYPTCGGEYAAGNWALYNVDIQHTFVHDTLREAMYIGPSHYGTVNANGYSPGFHCNNPIPDPDPTQDNPVVIPEAPVIGAVIRNNRVENIGNDGIQLSAATDGFLVEGNTVKDVGLHNDSSHSSGIQIGSGSKGVVNANWIENSAPRSTQGIKHSGLGDTWYTNNIIIGAQDGIMLLRNSDVNIGENIPNLYVYNNTIVNSASKGVSYWCNYHKNIFFANNLIASDSGLSNGAGGPGGESCFDQNLFFSYNGFYSSENAAGFVDAAQKDFHLQTNSPAVDGGFDLSGTVDEDYEGVSRTAPYDFGAYNASP